jgi:hypothetical protein
LGNANSQQYIDKIEIAFAGIEFVNAAERLAVAQPIFGPVPVETTLTITIAAFRTLIGRM